MSAIDTNTTTPNLTSNDVEQRPPQPSQPSQPPQSPQPSQSSQSQTQSKSQKGISIEEAMSILSCRASQNNEKEFQNVNPEMKRMGQTLDLMDAHIQQHQQTPMVNGNMYGREESALMKQEREELATQIRANQSQTMEDTTSANNTPATSNINSNTNTNTNANSNTNETATESKLKASLATQSPSELIQTLFQLQKERVATYQQFNNGLETVLQSKNFTSYPKIATHATASFVVLSNSIREIQRLFLTYYEITRDNDRGTDTDTDTNTNTATDTGIDIDIDIDIDTCKQIANFIKQLQTHEKEKLHLTAALHLEKMREQNEILNVNMDMDTNNDGGDNDNGNDNVNDSDNVNDNVNNNVNNNDNGTTTTASRNNGNNSMSTIANLLQQSISSLQGKLAQCIENINDVLEELRYALADL